MGGGGGGRGANESIQRVSLLVSDLDSTYILKYVKK